MPCNNLYTCIMIIVITIQLTYLFRKEKKNAIKQLVAVECCDGDVDKEAVQHGARYVGQGIGQHQHGQTNHHMRDDSCHPRLTHMDNSVRETQPTCLITVVLFRLIVILTVLKRS